MAPSTGALGVALTAVDAGQSASPSASSTSGAMSRTVLALTPGPTPRPAGNSGAGVGETRDSRRTAATASGLGWLAGSIGYIYIYLREKVDAGERRRRMVAERDGAERLLSGALKELGLTILKQGIQHGDLTGLLEAIGRAEARRETSVADIAASEKLISAEEGRLGAQELVLESEWIACDKAGREAEELIRGVSRDNQDVATRHGRTRDARTRLERDADAAEAAPDGKQRAAHLRHEAAGKQSEEVALEAQLARLDQQLVEMRERSSALRADAQGVRAKLDAAVATRRSAAAAMKASIAGHNRERADAEREVANLTEQLGRAAAQARPPAPTLTSIYQSIDRFEDTLADRAQQIAAVDQSLTHYDHKKLLTGVGLLTSLFALTAAGLWVALRK